MESALNQTKTLTHTHTHAPNHDTARQVQSDDLLLTIDEDASHEVDVMTLKFEAKLQKENEAGVALMVRKQTLDPPASPSPSP